MASVYNIIYIPRTKNQRGHSVCWLSTSTKKLAPMGPIGIINQKTRVRHFQQPVSEKRPAGTSSTAAMLHACRTAIVAPLPCNSDLPHGDMSRAASCDRRMHVTVNFRHASPRKSRKKLTETTHTSYEYEPCVNTSIVQFPLLEVLLLAKYQLHFFFRRPPQQKYLI